MVDFTFYDGVKHLTAVDAGWEKNGYRVFDLLDDSGTVMDTLMVHPLEDIQEAVKQWLNAK